LQYSRLVAKVARVTKLKVAKLKLPGKLPNLKLHLVAHELVAQKFVAHGLVYLVPCCGSGISSSAAEVAWLRWRVDAGLKLVHFSISIR
jgi:hypothetical protein